jgi:hypothetical protein
METCQSFEDKEVEAFILKPTWSTPSRHHRNDNSAFVQRKSQLAAQDYNHNSTTQALGNTKKSSPAPQRSALEDVAALPQATTWSN